MFSRTCEYAFRAMVYLARHEKDWPLSGSVIARGTGIPAKYLSKVLGDLVRARILTGTRGKLGGFRMVRSPREVTLLEVLQPFEHKSARRCPFGNPVCGDDHPCLGHDRWKHVLETYYRFLERTRVSDVAVERPSAAAPAPNRRRW